MNGDFEGRRRGCLEVHELDLGGAEVITAGEFSERALGGFAVAYDKRADKQTQAAIAFRFGVLEFGRCADAAFGQLFPTTLGFCGYGVSGRKGWP